MTKAETITHPANPRWERRKALTRSRLEQVSLRMFEEKGFDACTVDELAAEAHVGRRTFFRYFPTKYDVVLAGDAEQLAALREALFSADASDPVDLLRRAFHRANDFPPEEYATLATRIRLITTVPSLHAHTTGRYLEWADTIADAVAERFGHLDDLGAHALAQAALGMMWAAYHSWLKSGAGPDLPHRIDRVFALLHSGFAPPTPP